MNRFRLPALIALWLQVAAVYGLAAYALWSGQFGVGAWLSGIEAFLSALVLAWWTVIFSRVTAGKTKGQTDLASDTQPQSNPAQSDVTRDGNWRALLLVYPWLTAFRLGLWGITLLGVLEGLAPTANPVALTAMLTLWGGAIWASNASNAGLVRYAAAPGPQSRQALLDWLNLAAALSLAMTVMNLVPIAGYSPPPDLASQLVYGIEGVLDVVATLLAFMTFYTSMRQKREEIKIM